MSYGYISSCNFFIRSVFYCILFSVVVWYSDVGTVYQRSSPLSRSGQLGYNTLPEKWQTASTAPVLSGSNVNTMITFHEREKIFLLLLKIIDI